MTRTFFVFITIVLLSPSAHTLQAQQRLSIQWTVASRLPAREATAHPGVAGPFSGFSGGVLLIAGGANFPDAMPWEGGKKSFHKAVYAYDPDQKDSPDCKLLTEFSLDEPLAYGASVSYKDQLVCLGGENASGPSRKAFSLRWDPLVNRMDRKELPDLPLPLSNLSAALAGSWLYIAGGESGNLVSKGFYFLDLESLSEGWRSLPELPFPVSHTLLLPLQEGDSTILCLIGGRKKNPGSISTFYRSVYAYDIAAGHWQLQSMLPAALSAACGVSLDGKALLVFGGDKGETFGRVEAMITSIEKETDLQQKAEGNKEKDRLLSLHPGFSGDIWLLERHTGAWKLMGQMPAPAPVTTTAVRNGPYIYIPSGEVRAGVRSPDILLGKLMESAQ